MDMNMIAPFPVLILVCKKLHPRVNSANSRLHGRVQSGKLVPTLRAARAHRVHKKD